MPTPSASEGDVRRTGMAGERTLLAWWRTGLTSIAVALAVGRILPDLAPTINRWPFVVLGAAFAIYGIAFFVIGTRRMLGFDRELGSPASRPGEAAMFTAFTAGGALLGIGTLAVIIAH